MAFYKHIVLGFQAANHKRERLTLNAKPRYPLSKILLTKVIRYLGSSVAPLDRTGVVLNVLCPGLCTTSLDRYAPEAFRTKLAADRADHGRTAEQGSRTLLHGATAGAYSHGKFLSHAEIAE